MGSAARLTATHAHPLASAVPSRRDVRPFSPPRRLVGTAAASPRGRRSVEAHSWAFFKAVGLRKPGWLPDFGLEERRDTLQRFFGPISREVYEELVDDGFRMTEEVRHEAGESRTYFKADFIELMCSCVAPALPDFTWSAATDGKADKDGWALVAVRASGHHTGAQFSLPGLPPVEPSGRRVHLEEQLMRVRVEGGRIREIVVLPSQGAGPRALYKALAGGEGAARLRR